MSCNYLCMIWDVKILLAKIKDGKGKKNAVSRQEKFAHKNLAKLPQTGHSLPPFLEVN